MSLAQGNNTPTRPRIELGSPDPESDALTTRPCLRNCLFGIADPGVHRVGRSIAFFFFFISQKKLEVSASNPFEMQAKLNAELTDDIFRYYSVPKNSLLKHKTPLSEPLS